MNKDQFHTRKYCDKDYSVSNCMFNKSLYASSYKDKDSLNLIIFQDTNNLKEIRHPIKAKLTQIVSRYAPEEGNHFFEEHPEYHY